MTPYYADDRARIYLGDAREVLPTLGRGTVDLIVTDPPYGVDFKSGWSEHDRIAGDDGVSLDVPGVLALAARTMRERRHLYCFGPAALVSEPFTAAVELIWDKGSVSMGDLSQPWSRNYEPITFAVYTPSVKARDSGRGRLSARLRQGAVLRVPRLGGTASRRHPTEKPVPLLRMLIESSSLIGETVLDPFAGVGSTVVAAVAEGRRGVGIEIDERYCERAARRLEAMPAEAPTP